MAAITVKARCKISSGGCFHAERLGWHGAAAVGGLGELVVEKQKTDKATCAIARCPVDIQPQAIGRAQGYLSVIGIGPGSDEWRSPQATQALRDATDVVFQ